MPRFKPSYATPLFMGIVLALLFPMFVSALRGIASLSIMIHNLNSTGPLSGAISFFKDVSHWSASILNNEISIALLIAMGILLLVFEARE